jgi:exopolyphosphatase / guanosine-5'-triphosphate,3'-diphosphate pyrophosphatase
VKRPNLEPVLAAIDVGTNAVRLEMARPLPDGNIEMVHLERDPVRPGEGLFTTGVISRPVADRLLSTLRRYGALCRRFHARVRAIATSAVREARNRDEIVRRVRSEAGLNLEVVSGKEEARLICLGVLHGKPASSRSLVIDVGGGSTELALAQGERPLELWSIAIGAVRLAELFGASGTITDKQLALMRHYAREAVGEAVPPPHRAWPRNALGSSGTARAVISFAAAEGTGHVTVRQLGRAVDELAALGFMGRRRRFDSRRADIIVSGAVILEAVARHLSLASITAVDRSLRHGVLIDLMRRRFPGGRDTSLADEAIRLGRRLVFDERHAAQVAKLSLALFDGMTAIHGLSPAVRAYLETAALLHDVGNSVNYQKHHRHTQYLIQNADIPGLSDRERDLVARIARFHRRSAPALGHAAMAGLTVADARMVRKVATLLRVGDSLDRSHQQPIRRLDVSIQRDSVLARISARAPVDLEMWDVTHEAALFRSVFRRRLRVETQSRK